ncbi:hypothetical protein EQU24_12785 [Methylotuvimicrobium buryatense]|uniref:Uncharacterized protein n=1 Tax=Methylotuvimicrobium buryatense TaxID=95641 RepID=A0A4V1IJY4_METBY|nr:hypothetical protein EQU24_12785 [Methylotuvimicrobium buryatense]
MQGRKMLLHFLHSLHPCNSAIAEEQKSASAMDGVNADFAGAKICRRNLPIEQPNPPKIGKLFTTKSLPS